MSKRCQKMSKRCQKVVKKFGTPGKKQKKVSCNGAIVEKVQWCNSKKMNCLENNNNNNNWKKKIGIS
jgi:hypothetical protein